MKFKLPDIPKDRKDLELLSKEALTELVWQQQRLIEKLIEEVERLKGLCNKDSQTSSLPPSSDLLKRSEKTPVKKEKESDSNHRKPGGQLGHPGKTRKGFGRVDPYQVVEPERCPVCGGNHWETRGTTTRNYQVAQLVERPIEIVEYQQVRRFCGQCGEQVSGELFLEDKNLYNTRHTCR